MSLRLRILKEHAINPFFMAELTSNPNTVVQNQDDGVLDASITATATSCTISPVKKWINGVLTTGGFDSTQAFVKIIDSTGRYEFASYGTKSVSAANITTLSDMRRGLSPSAATITAGTGMAFDANTRIYVVDYAYMWQSFGAVLGAALIEKVIVLTDAATVTTNAALGNTFTLTTSQSFTMANPTNPTNGQKIIYKIKQGSGGSKIITWDTAFRGSNDITLPILTTDESYVDYIGFIYDSAATKWNCMASNRGFAT